MWKVYFKQIIYLLKENKFFSAVYIIGTALSITMMMIILITYHIKTANLGEENKRDRTAYVMRTYGVRAKDGKVNLSANLAPSVVEKWFYPVKTAEAVSQQVQNQSILFNEREQRYEELKSVCTDAGFWKIFSLRFVAGKGFNEAEVKSKALQVVINESTARRFFGSTDVVGRSVTLNWKDYKVCGVVKDVPSYLAEASAEIYLPYTTNEDARREFGHREVIGGMASCYFLLRSKDDMPKLKQELEHQVHLMNAGCKDMRFSLQYQPTDIFQRVLMMSNMDADSEKQQSNLRLICTLLGLFLVVPALNLSGLIVARMRRRGEEIGVRKAFGASTGVLMVQVMVENFVQVLIGGVVGLFLSYGIFQLLRDKLLFSIPTLSVSTDYSPLSFWHVIDVATISYVLVICFVLNLVSTLLPAWRYTRIPIVDALNRKRLC